MDFGSGLRFESNDQSLLINNTTNKSNLNELLASCEEYRHQKQIAQPVISEILVVVKDWKILATRQSIAKSEQERFATTFER